MNTLYSSVDQLNISNVQPNYYYRYYSGTRALQLP